jgi:hypothetical protein
VLVRGACRSEHTSTRSRLPHPTTNPSPGSWAFGRNDRESISRNPPGRAKIFGLVVWLLLLLSLAVLHLYLGT